MYKDNLVKQGSLSPWSIGLYKDTYIIPPIFNGAEVFSFESGRTNLLSLVLKNLGRELWLEIVVL